MIDSQGSEGRSWLLALYILGIALSSYVSQKKKGTEVMARSYSHIIGVQLGEGVTALGQTVSDDDDDAGRARVWAELLLESFATLSDGVDDSVSETDITFSDSEDAVAHLTLAYLHRLRKEILWM